MYSTITGTVLAVTFFQAILVLAHAFVPMSRHDHSSDCGNRKFNLLGSACFTLSVCYIVGVSTNFFIPHPSLDIALLFVAIVAYILWIVLPLKFIGCGLLTSAQALRYLILSLALFACGCVWHMAEWSS